MVMKKLLTNRVPFSVNTEVSMPYGITHMSRKTVAVRVTEILALRTAFVSLE